MAEARITLHPKMHHPKSIRLVETHWGYILSAPERAQSETAVSDAALRFVGIVLVMTAYAVWLVPASLVPDAPVALKPVMAGLLAVSGAILFALPRFATTYETQIDNVGREIRHVRRVRNANTRVIWRIPFGAVESVFIRRSDTKPAEMHLRIAADDSVQILSGLERELNLVHARLCRDLKSPQDRMEMRLSVAPPKPARAIRLRQAGGR